MQGFRRQREEYGGRAQRSGAAVPPWETIYEELGEKVFRLLHRLTRRPELAADLTHDTFVRVFERIHLFDGRGPIGGWVYRIARNLALDHFKRPDPFVTPDAELEPRANDGAAGRAELHLSLRRALGSLPEHYRVVLLLHDVDGYTHDEIAQMLDIAGGTSKARLSRGRSMLREALSRSG